MDAWQSMSTTHRVCVAIPYATWSTFRALNAWYLAQVHAPSRWRTSGVFVSASTGIKTSPCTCASIHFASASSSADAIDEAISLA